jgi:hypothetical protein
VRLGTRNVLFGDAVLLLLGLGLLAAAGVTVSGVDFGEALPWLRRWGLAIALGALGVAGVVDGLSRILRTSQRSSTRLPVRPLRAWMSAAMVVVVVTATWAGVTWVLAATNPTDPQARVEAIKTGLAIGAGTGAAIALYLTTRRQWLNERAQAHTEADATERRVTELYTKAADQLGADKDPVVRLAALYSLERLAQTNPQHRQTIVNIICGYLRMPFTPPPEQPAHPSRGLGLRQRRPAHHRTVFAAEPSASLTDRKQELQVRLTAQRILAEHLQPGRNRKGRPTNPKFWSDIDLDLTGATLIDVNFAYCHVNSARFTNAIFRGRTGFIGATIGGTAVFRGASFRGLAVFEKASFRRYAVFDGVSFQEDVWFDGATFDEETGFREASFRRDVWFEGAIFRGDAVFREGSFGGSAWFVGATFGGHAWFEGASFSEAAGFDAARVRIDVEMDHYWPPGWVVRPVTAAEGHFAGLDGGWGFLERGEPDAEPVPPTSD